jgi:hypothetical protein
MTRAEFAHTVRAAGGVLGMNDVLVIGSQALHGSVEDGLPPEATRSVEADIAALDDRDGSQADLIDGSIGEASMFHASFGYYAQGVTPTTARLPDGWRERLVRFETSATNGVVAWCLEPHDLWVSKMIAHRPKDLEFGAALLRLGIVEPVELRRRLKRVPDLDEPTHQAILAKLTAWADAEPEGPS